MTRLAVAATLALALALALVSFAEAQGGQGVEVSQVDCTGDPEIVVVTNAGDAAQNLTGWELRSDPEASEVFDLSVLGSLLVGGSVSIGSGPSASGVFIWMTNEVFRDNDATDYVKLVDDTGATVQQVNCTVEATPTPTPGAEEMPDGGGPPPPSAELLSPGMMILIGGSLAAAGLGAIALPWLRLRSSPVAASSAPGAGRLVEGEKVAGKKPDYLAASLAAVAFTAVMVFRLLRRLPD